MSSEILSWLDQVEDDLDNLRAALEWSYLEGNGQEYALRISSALFRYWWMRGSLAEGAQWITQGLALETALPDLDLPRARAFYIASWIISDFYKEGKILEFAQRAVELYRKIGEAGLPELVIALANEAQILQNVMNKPDQVSFLLDEGEAIGRRLGQPGAWSLAMLLWIKSSFCYSQGDFEKAQSISKESWALFLQIGDRWNAGPLMVLGLVAQGQKRYDLAQRYYEDALAAYSEINDRGGIVFALNNLTFLSIVLGDLQQAARYYREQLRIWQTQGTMDQIIGYIKIGCFFSTMELLKAAPEEAVEKFRTVLSVLELSVSLQPEVGPSFDQEALISWYLENAKAWADYNAQPFTEDERASIRANLVALMSTLGEEGFREALVQAKSLDLEQAISRILDFPL